MRSGGAGRSTAVLALLAGGTAQGAWAAEGLAPSAPAGLSIALALGLGAAGVVLALLALRLRAARAEVRRLAALLLEQAGTAARPPPPATIPPFLPQAPLLTPVMRAGQAREIRPWVEALLAPCAELAASLQQRHQAELLERIERGGRQALGLIDAMLDQADIEAGALRLEARPFEIETVLGQVADALAARAHAKGLDFIIELEPDVPLRLLGDARRLAELLCRLGDNALRHTAHGEVFIHVGLDAPRVGLPPLQPDEPLLLRCELSDTGAGVAQDELERRLRGPAVAGAGRGLFIGRHLAELMGGRLTASSQPGEGAIFTLTAALRVAPPGAGIVATAPERLRGRRVLVVEGNEHARQMIRRLLEGWGIEVLALDSGHAAMLAAAAADSLGRGFDMVLVDWTLPGVSGAETVRLLRSRGLRSLPLVVKMSAPDPADDEGGPEPDADAVLHKPVLRQALLEVLLGLLEDEAPQGRAAPAKTARTAQSGDTAMPPEIAALAGARVLLVEDNDSNQQIAIDLLQGSGMRVQVAEHGQAAIELLNWQYFDLVLMDLYMPRLDGIRATQLIRADRRHQALPIVAMTVTSREADRRRCREAGMNAHLTKPFELEELWAVLARWITPRPGLGLGEATAGPPGAGDGSDDTDHDEAAGPVAPVFHLPESIPGIDTGQALRRMRGQTELYLRVARMFVDTQADACQRVRDALKAGDRETALRFATTLKNLAANLGARGLQDHALALEASLREAADPMVMMAIGHVENSLEVVCFALQSLIAGQARPAPASVARRSLQ